MSSSPTAPSWSVAKHPLHAEPTPARTRFMDAATAILLGLVGGLHCAGMCGPLMLALPVTGRTRGAFLTGRCAYQAGRILVYATLGTAFGAFGQVLALAGVQRWVSLSLGALLLAGALSSPRLLEFPALIHCVARLRTRMAAHLQRRSIPSLATLGALNGLLPCGLVYAACAGAAATGSALHGAAFMALFGLGTTPMMLGISLSGRLIPPALRLRLRHLTPATLGLMGALLVLRGLALGIPYLSPDLQDPNPSCHPGPTPQAITASH